MTTALATLSMDREKVELIKQTVAKGATDLELELFLHVCQRTGLDPLTRQIHAIKRWDSTANREVMAIQTGIDGYRLIADRTERYAGSDEPQYTLGDDGFPDVASVTVYKMLNGQRCPFTASARWNEYVQKKKDGTITSFWAKMPFGQLGKCAEALALRKAFPAELSGVYTHDEMQQADTVLSEPAGKTSDQKFTAISNQPVDTKQAFAQKFPEQAKAIEEKLRQGDGAGTDQQATMHANTPPQQASDAPASLFPGMNVGAYLLQFPKELKGQRIGDVTEVHLAWLSKYYNEKLAVPANAQSPYRQEWEAILQEVWAEQVRRDAPSMAKV